MTTTNTVIPFSLKDAPALIESVLPVQRLSIDSYKEQMAVQGKTLTALGSYWKGRKPLVLNRACVLASLLPATAEPKKDLEIFEMLMSMDDISVSKRKGLPKPDDIVRNVQILNIWRYFTVTLEKAKDMFPESAPFEVSNYPVKDNNGKFKTPSLRWRKDVSEDDKHRLAAKMLPAKPYRELVAEISRAEELLDTVHTHIWGRVNKHLGTQAHNYPELVEQLGIMRFGHRPRVADTFSGSGQIPFESARLGCDVYASDLNPIASMLTWGALNVVGASNARRKNIKSRQLDLLDVVKTEIDKLGIETDGGGWRGKAYLYCLEVTCPTSGWKVPVLSSRLVCKNKRVIIDLLADKIEKRYNIVVRTDVSDEHLLDATVGTYIDETIVHYVDGIKITSKISTIRGDYTAVIDGKKTVRNRLRRWCLNDITFRPDDIYQERLYAIQWIKDDGSSRPLTEYRSVTLDDLGREVKVVEYVRSYLVDWQNRGWVPDMRIEVGGPPRYQGRSLVNNMGWTHWNHAFNPRQLLTLSIFRKYINAEQVSLFTRALDYGSRMSHLNHSNGNVENVFYNQALNPLMDYGCRGFAMFAGLFKSDFKHFNIYSKTSTDNADAQTFASQVEIFITDPPYGDAVKFEEILDFFIAWLRNNPPPEFRDWVWDSRRALAIKGEDHDFKLSMVAAYKRMTECIPDNGLQIIMFTHQSGAIWAVMANIVWASGLQVTAAWYVVTETDSALREGQYVKGTILLVLRKRLQELEAARDELAYELAAEVKKQVDLLTGLNKDVKDIYRDENLFEDADLQMAGYAAAMRVLTRYSIIDGINMPQESLRPRVKGQTTMVDELIDFAVNIANGYLVPDGVDSSVWEKSTGIERFYLKMLDMEAKGLHTMSNYQNFAKAFKVQDYGEVMNEVKANHASLKSAAQLGKRGMNASDEFGSTVLRSVLYGVYLLQEDKINPEDVLHQLRDLVPDYFRERERITALADYISKRTAKDRPDESSNAMVLRDLVRREPV